MESQTWMAYKGKESTQATEFAVVSFSADKVELKDDGARILLLDGKGDVGVQISAVAGAKFRKVG